MQDEKTGAGPDEGKSYKVELNGVKFKARWGDHVENYLDVAPHKGKLPPLGVIINNRLAGLMRRITCNCKVRTVDYGSKEGAYIYRRTACFILYTAAKRLFPKAEVVIGQSIHRGYFFDLPGKKVTPKVVASLGGEMRRIVKENLRIAFKRVFVDEAIEIFRALGRKDKAVWISQIPREHVWMAELLGFHDLLHGPLAPSTGPILNFSLEPYRHGFILRFPNIDGSRPGPPKSRQKKLFDTFLKTRREHELLGVRNVSQLIDECVHGNVEVLIEASEALFKKRILKLSDRIEARKDDVRVILIAGPSASGKSSCARRRGTFLRILGIKPVNLSMDDYYVERDKTPRHRDGTYNLEHIEALDLPLFNDHLSSLIAGREVESPVFDFTVGRRDPARTIRRVVGENEVLLIEGIHALNDRLHQEVPRKNKFKIFVSALTQLSIDQHNRIFTSDTRLLRRIVRDRLFRGYSAAETINNWASVRSGEVKWIFPFQDSADASFNSAHIYEHAVLKPYAERFLLEIPPDNPAYVEASRLYEFIELFLPIFPEEVPRDSVLREFIGGGTN